MTKASDMKAASIDTENPVWIKPLKLNTRS